MLNKLLIKHKSLVFTHWDCIISAAAIAYQNTEKATFITVVKMESKMKCRWPVLLWLCVGLMGTLMWGCKPTAATPPKAEVCIRLANGELKCAAIGGDSLLLLEPTAQGPQMSRQSAKGLLAASQQGTRTAAAALAEDLKQTQATFTFDPKTEQIEWAGDQLIVGAEGGKLPKRIYNTADAMSVMLLQPDPSGSVIGAILGNAHCDSFFDVGALVDSLSILQREPLFVVFSEFDGVYYAGAADAAVGGGLTIIIVDPAIIENDWHVASGLRLDRDFGWDEWSTGRTGMAAPKSTPFFIPIAQTRPDYSNASGVTHVLSGSSSADGDLVRRQYAGFGIENFELLCKIDPDVDIELCDSAFHFWQNGRLVQQIPQFPCAIGIRRFKGTEIYKYNKCEWRAPVGLPCSRLDALPFR